MFSLKKLPILILILITISSCSNKDFSRESFNGDLCLSEEEYNDFIDEIVMDVQTQTADEIYWVLTEEAVYSPQITETNSPIPTLTLTSSPEPTLTLTSTPEPTALHSPGDTVQCADMWEIVADNPLSFGTVYTNKLPKGEYGQIYFLLTNLQNKTASLNMYSDSLELVGFIAEDEVVFDSTGLAPSIQERSEGIVFWTEDIPPLIQVRAQAVFDVNPDASNWRLRLIADDCLIEVPLYPSD